MTGGITPEMLKLCWVTYVKVFFLVLIYVFNFDSFEFSVAILEKGLLDPCNWTARALAHIFKKCLKRHLKTPSKTQTTFRWATLITQNKALTSWDCQTVHQQISRLSKF